MAARQQHELADEVMNCVTADDLFTMVARRNQMIESLQEEWEGNSCNKFIAESEEATKALQEAGDSLAEFGTTPHNIASRFEELDSTL